MIARPNPLPKPVSDRAYEKHANNEFLDERSQFHHRIQEQFGQGRYTAYIADLESRREELTTDYVEGRIEYDEFEESIESVSARYPRVYRYSFSITPDDDDILALIVAPTARLAADFVAQISPAGFAPEFVEELGPVEDFDLWQLPEGQTVLCAHQTDEDEPMLPDIEPFHTPSLDG